jgi:hypothetical protein
MATTADATNRPRQQADEQKMIDGFNKHGQTINTLLVRGTTYKPADIVIILQARLATAKAVDSARSTWQAAVAADRDERAKTKTFVSGIRQALLVAFADSIDVLADFGLSPRKKAVVSPETRAAAAVKAKATREARHTMGKKQKAKIKAAAPAPASAPAASAPTPAPAPAVRPQ